VGNYFSWDVSGDVIGIWYLNGDFRKFSWEFDGDFMVKIPSIATLW